MPRSSTDHQEDSFFHIPPGWQISTGGDLLSVSPIPDPEMNDPGQINVLQNVGSWPLQPIRMAATRQTLFIGNRKLHTKRETDENESAIRQEKPPRGNLVPSESRSRLYYNLEGVRLLTTRQHKIVNERPTTTQVAKTVR